MSPLEVLWQYREAFFNGFVVTLQLLALSSLIGTCIGVSLEWLCQQLEGGTRRTIDVISFCISTIPALVLLFWLYYPAQALLDISVSPFWTATVALVLLNTFAVYRISADAIRDFPNQYNATALVCGLKPLQITRYIQAPLLLRAALPRWIDQQAVVLQTSVFASLISVDEIFRAAQRINSVAYQPVVIYTSMALIFLLTAGSAMYGARYLRSKFHRDFSER